MMIRRQEVFSNITASTEPKLKPLSPTDPQVPGFELLGELHEFPADCFFSENSSEQIVCDFVLVLALAFNDIHNVMWARGQIQQVTKGKTHQISPAWGQIAGFDWYTWRIIGGIFNELLKMINKNEEVFGQPLWQKLVNKLSKEDQSNWNDICLLANEKMTDGDLKKTLERYRNNITFHYYEAGKPLRKGLKNYKQSAQFKGCLISIGDNMVKTRFYFADAAAEHYMDSVKDRHEFDRELAGPAGKLVRILKHIVERFIYLRGGSLAIVRK